MYKKFMLHLLLVAAFSNNQSLHASNDPSEPIRQVITFVIAKISENSWYVLEKAQENSSYILEQIFEQIKENNLEKTEDGKQQENPVQKISKDVVNTVVGGVVYVGSVVFIQTGNAVYDWCFPKKENIAKQAEAEVRTEEANKRLKYLKAEANFSECLKKIKKDAPQNAEGIPTACEEKARDLVLCGGKVAVHNMMNDFNS